MVHYFTPSQRKTPHSYINLALLAAQFLPNFTSTEQSTTFLLQKLTPIGCKNHTNPQSSTILYCNFGPVVLHRKSSHCSPLHPTLTSQFWLGGNSLKVLPFPSIAIHFYFAVLAIALHCNPLLHSSFGHCTPLQPTLLLQCWQGLIIHPSIAHIVGHCYIAVLIRGYFFKIPVIAVHCRPLVQRKPWPGGFKPQLQRWFIKIRSLHATPTSQFLASGGGSSKVLQLQPIASHTFYQNFGQEL